MLCCSHTLTCCCRWHYTLQSEGVYKVYGISASSMLLQRLSSQHDLVVSGRFGKVMEIYAKAHSKPVYELRFL